MNINIQQANTQPNDTACKYCVFARYSGRTQTDCQLWFLDAFRKLGTTVLDAYDDDKEFFVIKDRQCIGYRENDWLEKQENPLLSVRKEINLRYSAAIGIAPTCTLEQLENTLKSLASQNIEPRHVIFLLQGGISLLNLRQLANKYVKNWRVEILSEGVSLTDGWDVLKSKMKTMYWMYCAGGFVIPTNFILSLNYAINYECRQLLVVTPYDEYNNCFVTQHILFKIMNGNVEIPYLDKIKSLTEEYEECKPQIVKAETLLLPSSSLTTIMGNISLNV